MRWEAGMQITDCSAYEILQKERIEDVHADGYLLRHKKSGARVMLLANQDENKVFNIIFRTPPADSTGVAHILEHSVLCGSREFPLKDPFVELVKGSLNTFLNAMTYPDKTMYPVASCNDQDFKNLMHVYMDAVFYPNIYEKEEIFRQEGWHYQLEQVDDPLKYNGVVYNEMKGAFSSSEEVLEFLMYSFRIRHMAWNLAEIRNVSRILRMKISWHSMENIIIHPTVIFFCMEIWIWQNAWNGWTKSI